jgi:tetratricopeptide (TPR) repeat protein
LVQSGGRLVSKERLVDEVWSGAPIGDNNIAQHMHMARDVLGDVSKPHRYIATVHGRGYRLLVEPHPVNVPRRIPIPPAADGDVAARALAAELFANAAFFTTMGTPAALESSSQLCRKALEVDPAFADAHAGIAINAILTAVFLFGPAPDQFLVARRHAVEALELEPRSARAHIAMAALALLADISPASAHAHLDTAAASIPDLRAIGILRIAAFTAQGEHAAARRAAADTSAAQTASSALTSYAAFAAYHAGDFESARTMLERLLVFRPGCAFATYMLALTRLVQGEYGAARELFGSLLAGRISLIPSYEKFRQRATGALSFIEARTGSIDDARALARDVQRNVNCSYVSLAMARAGAGEEDSVIACLERAREQRDPWFPFVGSDPIFREYVNLPEFPAASQA